MAKIIVRLDQVRWSGKKVFWKFAGLMGWKAGVPFSTRRCWRRSILECAWMDVKLAFVLACTTGVLALAGMAQESKPPSNGPAQPLPRGRPSPQPTLSPLLRALDANHDGVIDADELANATEALEALDKNGDGQLTPDEYQTVPRPPPSRGRGPGFSANRTNGPAFSRVPQGGLVNFAVVDEHLLRGAQPSAAGIQTLKALGVKMIVDLTLPDALGQAEKSEAERNGLVYTNMPLVSVARPTTNEVASILSTITNAPGRVFIHCQAGKDRTGTIVACYRILKDRWTTEQALSEADQFRMAERATWFRGFIKDFGPSQDGLSRATSESDSTQDPDTVNRLMQKRKQEEHPPPN
jgi:protein tyrosine phosphatase (PTP) superfamily phosphohydrolase (DUF442 family)